MQYRSTQKAKGALAATPAALCVLKKHWQRFVSWKVPPKSSCKKAVPVYMPVGRVWKGPTSLPHPIPNNYQSNFCDLKGEILYLKYR